MIRMIFGNEEEGMIISSSLSFVSTHPLRKEEGGRKEK